MIINAILIDDERKALAILKNKIERLCPNVNIIAETQNPVEGIEFIKNLKPQLVFLDVAMPELSGFDLLSEIKNPDFEIIFATAFDNYAIEAIKHCAIGYLVKPVDNNDLVETVNKAIQNIEDKSAL
jgi:two-component system LytT family response regulator